jgi:hypothetical protein
MDALTSGREVHRPLIEALAATPLADLCDYPARERLWGNPNVGAGYLEATADGWLRRAVDTEVPFVPDQYLGAFLLKGTAVDRILSALVDDVPKGIGLIEAIPCFDEQRFVNWLGPMISNGPPMLIGTAEAIGRIILARQWHRALEQMVAGYHRRSDLKPALRICSSMIGFFTRWTLDLSIPTVTEKWASFFSLASDLYPSGPDHEELWSRAGGRNSDLPTSGSGRSRWRTALEQARNGRGPSSSKLIHEMQRDYPGNQELRILGRDPDLSGRRY